MNRLTVLLALVLSLLASACNKVRYRESPAINETAIVVDIRHSEARSSELGAGLGGEFGLQELDDEPEEFEVRFKTITGKELFVDKPETWLKFKDHKGELVNLSYSKIDRIEYKKVDGKERIRKLQRDYDLRFIDAELLDVSSIDELFPSEP